MARITSSTASSPTMPPRLAPSRPGRSRRRRASTPRPRACARRLAPEPRAPPARATRPGRASRRRRAARSGRRRRVPPRGSHSRTSGSSAASSPASTYGGFETTRSNGPARPASRSPSRNSTSRPFACCVLAGQFERASASCRSQATRAPGRSCAIASAIAPPPVPTSTTRGESMPSSRARQRSTTISVSGRGTSARASVFSVSRRKSQSPSTYASGSRFPRRWTSPRAARALGVGQRAVVLGVELDPREAERAREQELGVEPRALDSSRRQVFGRAAQDLCERHPSSARRCSAEMSASV